MNIIVVLGNLTRDPELRSTQSGKQVCNFIVAVNRKLPGGTEKTMFYQVSAWDKLAEICGKFLNKGKKVCVVGEPDLSVFTKRDGTTSASIAIRAKEVEFITSRYDETEGMEESVQEAANTYEAGGYMQVSDEELPF